MSPPQTRTKHQFSTTLDTADAAFMDHLVKTFGGSKAVWIHFALAMLKRAALVQVAAAFQVDAVAEYGRRARLVVSDEGAVTLTGNDEPEHEFGVAGGPWDSLGGTEWIVEHHAATDTLRVYALSGVDHVPLHVPVGHRRDRGGSGREVLVDELALSLVIVAGDRIEPPLPEGRPTYDGRSELSIWDQAAGLPAHVPSRILDSSTKD